MVLSSGGGDGCLVVEVGGQVGGGGGQGEAGGRGAGDGLRGLGFTRRRMAAAQPFLQLKKN